MRKLYYTAMKNHFHANLMKSRTRLCLTQAQMAERLCMDERSYVDLDHGKTCCSALTLSLYLVYICDDVERFLEGLRNAFEAEKNSAA